MEVNREESEQWKYQTQTNQIRIPFPHGASCPDGEARLYGIPIVRGMPLSRTWFSLSGRGRWVYAHTTDETIKEGETNMNIPFPSRGQVEYTRSCFPSLLFLYALVEMIPQKKWKKKTWLFSNPCSRRFYQRYSPINREWIKQIFANLEGRWCPWKIDVIVRIGVPKTGLALWFRQKNTT